LKNHIQIVIGEYNNKVTTKIETLEGSDRIEFKSETITISEMAQSLTEFIRLATSLIPEFDGKPEIL